MMPGEPAIWIATDPATGRREIVPEPDRPAYEPRPRRIEEFARRQARERSRALTRKAVTE